MNAVRRWSRRLAIGAAVLLLERIIVEACIERVTTRYHHEFWGKRP